MSPRMQSTPRYDFYAVESRDGERLWLQVPRGTPAKTFTQELRPAPAAFVAA